MERGNVNLESIEVSHWFAMCVGVIVAAAAATDLRTRRIPNGITIPAAFGGIVFHCVVPGAWGFSVAATGLLVGFALLLLPHFLGGGGMGDVKLLAALGAWMGSGLLLVTFTTSIFAATAMILAAGIVRGAGVLMRSFSGRADDHTPAIGDLVGDGGATDTVQSGTLADATTDGTPRERVVPFAVPVAFATWCVLAWFVTTRGF